MKNRTIFIICILFIINWNPAFADRPLGKHHKGTRHFDYANVIQVDPIYKYVKSTGKGQKCKQDEQVRERQSQQRVPNQNTDALAQKRQDYEQHKRMDSKRAHQEQNRKIKCKEPKPQKRIIGYTVKYKYNGHTYQAKMNKRPGRRLKVKVQVEPHLK